MAEMEKNQTQDLSPSDDGVEEQTPAALEAVSDESAELDRDGEEEVELPEVEEEELTEDEIEESTTLDQKEPEALLEGESQAEAPIEDEEHGSLDEPGDEPVLASEAEMEVVEGEGDSAAVVENEIDTAVESDLSAVEEGFEPEPEVEVEQPSEPEAVEPEGEPDDGRHWYVVHCYSGYENKVRHNLEQRIETMGMKAEIFDVVVPTEEEIEVKDGKRRTVERRVFPGYILVQMILSEESWYVVRNTPGVTGFVGMGNEPTPLSPEEVASIVKRMEAEAPRIKVTYTVGQKVRIIDGPFNDFIGTVDNIDMERAKVRVMVSFFGRDTPVELDFLQVDKG